MQSEPYVNVDHGIVGRSSGNGIGKSQISDENVFGPLASQMPETPSGFPNGNEGIP